MIAAARVSFMFVGGYLHNTKTVGRLIITLSVCWFFLSHDAIHQYICTVHWSIRC